MGNNGVKQAAYLSSKNAHTLAENLAKKGYNVLNKDFFNEFILKVNNTDEFLKKMKEKNILGGIKLDDNKVLVCTTETNTQEELEAYCQNA